MFNEIVIQCINKGIVSGETVVADGSFLPANISLKSSVEVVETIQQSSIHYLDELEKEMSEIPGYQPPMAKEVTKRSLKSSTDPDCGYINQKNKKGLGYLTEMTVDTSHGIITGVDCYPANHRESDIILNHIKKQKETLPIELKAIALDGGYDVGAVHRGLELLGIDGYTIDYIHVHANNVLGVPKFMHAKSIVAVSESMPVEIIRHSIVTSSNTRLQNILGLCDFGRYGQKVLLQP